MDMALCREDARTIRALQGLSLIHIWLGSVEPSTELPFSPRRLLFVMLAQVILTQNMPSLRGNSLRKSTNWESGRKGSGDEQLRWLDVYKRQPYVIGRKLAEKVVKSLGATSVPSFRGSVILTPYAGLDLLIEPIVFSINAENIQNGQSQWKGKLDSRVSSPLLSITDDPTLPRQVGSSAFDREGVPTKPLAILERGILSNYLYNCYTARRDGLQSNGHAVGSDQSVPGIGVTNLVVAPGKVSLEEMIEGTSKGLVVNRYSGSVDPVSGDFSGVVKGGHYIESGKVIQPVKEVMIAGNIYELLGQILSLIHI